MKTLINNKYYDVTATGNHYYYFSPKAGRKLPVAKHKVIFNTTTVEDIEPLQALQNPLGVKIEKGIDIPLRSSNFTTKVRQTLAMMQVGESFLFPCTTKKYHQDLMVAVSYASKIENKYAAGKKFCTRAVDGGRRVWRIA